jgi:hypothetical protein
MTQVETNQDFPDTFYELRLFVQQREKIPTLQVIPIKAKLVDGVYHRRGGFTFQADELGLMFRNDPRSDLCRGASCLEQDIPEVTARMRADILKEAQVRFNNAQKDLAAFQLDPVTTDEEVY